MKKSVLGVGSAVLFAAAPASVSRTPCRPLPSRLRQSPYRAARRPAALRRATLKRTGGERAPNAEIPPGSADVGLLRSEEADNALETTLLCLGASPPGRRVA